MHTVTSAKFCIWHALQHLPTCWCRFLLQSTLYLSPNPYKTMVIAHATRLSSTVVAKAALHSKALFVHLSVMHGVCRCLAH